MIGVVAVSVPTLVAASRRTSTGSIPATATVSDLKFHTAHPTCHHEYNAVLCSVTASAHCTVKNSAASLHSDEQLLTSQSVLKSDRVLCVLLLCAQHCRSD
jgi:hypothetical protein